MVLDICDYPGEYDEPEIVYELHLSVAALPIDTFLCVENLECLPLAGHFVGLIDRGTGTEEKVLVERRGHTLNVLARGWGGTCAFAHPRWNQSREAHQLASNMAVQMKAVFGAISPKGAVPTFPPPSPPGLAEMEELVFAPVYEWVAEGEARAVKEFELA